jgi:hypothetical protein
MVPYLAQAGARPDAVPRLTVVTSLNIACHRDKSPLTLSVLI